MRPTFIHKYKGEKEGKVSTKDRNVRFYGLMAVLALLLSVSVVSCCCLHGKGQTQNINVCLCNNKEQKGGDGYGTGRFVGSVKNKDTGALISGATLVFDGPQDVSDVSDPGYSTGWIVSGTYDITVSKPGFPTINNNDVVLHTDETRSKIYYLDPTP